MLLLRNSGLYELLPVLLVLALYLKRTDRRRLLLSLCAVLAIYSGVTKGLYPSLGIEEGSIKEALSIPFQQTALYVNRFPDEVTEEEKLVIDSVLDYDRLMNITPGIR